jgi:hypothetical protein
MEGDLKVFPLTEVLELIHAHRRSGVLEVREGVLPLTLRFAAGEVVEASILDWEGLEALFTFPLHPKEGAFRFQPGPPLPGRGPSCPSPTSLGGVGPGQRRVGPLPGPHRLAQPGPLEAIRPPNLPWSRSRGERASAPPPRPWGAFPSSSPWSGPPTWA